MRRSLIACFSLWVALGIALAPARPMPGMEMGPLPASTQPVAEAMEPMPGHGSTGHGNTGHGSAEHGNTELNSAGALTPEPPDRPPAPEVDHSGQAHQPNCVLCVVGAGTLALVVTVVWDSSRTRTVDLSLPRRLEPRRFRHFRSRAPPAVLELNPESPIKLRRVREGYALRSLG